MDYETFETFNNKSLECTRWNLYTQIDGYVQKKKKLLGCTNLSCSQTFDHGYEVLSNFIIIEVTNIQEQ